MVEQRNHNPLVRGPNPFAATKNSNRVYPGFNFWYWDLEHDEGVRPAAKRRDNASLPSGKFCKGVKRSETIPSRIVSKPKNMNFVKTVQSLHNSTHRLYGGLHGVYVVN